LSAAGGGTLVNSNGERGEKGTFGRAAKWADYRGNWHACTEGVAILCHPSNRWFPTPWFTRDYGFFSPTPMFWLEKDLLELEKGETITLRYRVVVHADSPSPAELDSLFAAWARE
jgi:hypothetical protein